MFERPKNALPVSHQPEWNNPNPVGRSARLRGTCVQKSAARISCRDRAYQGPDIAQIGTYLLLESCSAMLCGDLLSQARDPPQNGFRSRGQALSW